MNVILFGNALKMWENPIARNNSQKDRFKCYFVCLVLSKCHLDVYLFNYVYIYIFFFEQTDGEYKACVNRVIVEIILINDDFYDN